MKIQCVNVKICRGKRPAGHQNTASALLLGQGYCQQLPSKHVSKKMRKNATFMCDVLEPLHKFLPERIFHLLYVFIIQLGMPSPVLQMVGKLFIKIRTKMQQKQQQQQQQKQTKSRLHGWRAENPVACACVSLFNTCEALVPTKWNRSPGTPSLSK